MKLYVSLIPWWDLNKAAAICLNTKERPSVTNETDEISSLAKKETLDLYVRCHVTDSLHLRGVEIQHYATDTRHFILEMQLITRSLHCLQDGGLSLKAQLALAFEPSQRCLLHIWCDAAHGTLYLCTLALHRPSLTKCECWVVSEYLKCTLR